ncbi:hypothetical protein KJ877_07855 [bacterium]|nr:hypothetical protein [bacterium]MBU1990920.1 hypothetical protein [bacterium]
MLIADDYEILKSSFIDSQRLFDKLNRVADQVSELEYDESGLFLDQEETYERHWLKLSSKIVDALSSSLKNYNIELLKNKSLTQRTLTFNLSKDKELSKIHVDYSENGSLSISQMS